MNPEKPQSTFKFKQFQIVQDNCTMKVNTDGILLGAWANLTKDKHILDIGTGTALIALMAAQRAREAKVVGVEIEEKSFIDAVENAKNSPFFDRVEIVWMSIQDYSKSHEGAAFDHIISNPPFFTGGTFSANENKANVRHAIKLPHGDLLFSVLKLLKVDGKFSLILPHIEGLRFIELAERSGLFPSAIAEVIPRPNKGVERLLITLSRKKQEVVRSELSIYVTDENTYTDEFIALTKDFYIHF